MAPNTERDALKTRSKLLAAAAECCATEGYFRTDSNKIARAAGFAPATFYKHFADKRDALLASYDAWVTTEWARVERTLSTAAASELPQRLARAVLAHHAKWAGLRRSLRAAAATDEVVREFQLDRRRAQLAWLARLEIRARGGPPHDRSRRLALLLELERLCDAVADGDAKRLGVADRAMARQVERVIADYLS